MITLGTEEAGETAEKLATLNKKWRELQQKARDRQSELEDALREAQRYAKCYTKSLYILSL